MGKRCGRIQGRATRRDLPGARSPALQPAPALIGARGRPPASSPAPPSQSGPPELGLSRGAGGDGAGWRLSRPPHRVPAGPAPTASPSRRLRSLPRALSGSGSGRGSSASLGRLKRAPTAPAGARRRRLSAAFRRAPALARSPASGPAPGSGWARPGAAPPRQDVHVQVQLGVALAVPGAG